MSRPLKLQIVEQARTLIADEQHWCRGDLARDINGEEVAPGCHMGLYADPNRLSQTGINEP